MDLLVTVPGLREAIERETEDREFDFLDAPELLCGVEVMPLSIRRLLRLQAVNSPFLYKVETYDFPEDVAVFLWALSPNYERALRVRQWCEMFSFTLGRVVFGRIRLGFVRQLRKLKLGDAAKACRHYVTRAFEDSPGVSGVVGPNYYGWPAGYVGMLVTEYGWSEASILDMPLRRVFQYVRRIILKHDSDAVMFNPSDRLRGEWLKQQNALN